MDILLHLQEYLLFNRWLQQTHPRRYKKFSQHILVPRDQRGIGIIRDGLEQKHYDELSNLLQSYYQVAEKSN